MQLSKEERRERSDDAVWRFELYASVDGRPPQAIALSRSFHFIGVEGNPHFTKIHYVQFPAGTYAPGTAVVFTGIWYGDSDDDDASQVELTRSRTVTFT